HTFYAPQTFEAPDGRRLLLAWMGAFTLPLASQRADGWSGQLTVPRELSLCDDLRLRSVPVAEIAALREDTRDLGAFELGPDDTRMPLEDAEAYEVELEVDLSRTTSEQVGLEVHRTGEGLCSWVA